MPFFTLRVARLAGAPVISTQNQLTTADETIREPCRRIVPSMLTLALALSLCLSVSLSLCLSVCLPVCHWCTLHVREY